MDGDVEAREQEPEVNTRTLFVEDDRVINIVGGKMLAGMGIECETAFNVEEAEQKFTKAYNEGNPFRVLLTDRDLKGESGVDFAKKAREIEPNIVVVLASGHGYTPEEIEAMKQDRTIDYHVRKPYSSKDIEEAFNQIHPLLNNAV